MSRNLQDNCHLMRGARKENDDFVQLSHDIKTPITSIQANEGNSRWSNQGRGTTPLLNQYWSPTERLNSLVEELDV